MTVYQKAAEVIETTLRDHGDEPGDWLARRILDNLRAVRIVPHTLRASEEMFTRFHAHCRFLGNETGRGYRHYYNKAIAHAMTMERWPCQVIPRRVKLDTGQVVDVDVPVPSSTTKASNAQLLEAYSVITDEAKREGIELPEE